MKVKLILPPIIGAKHFLARRAEAPYGLGILASCLRKNGFKAEIEDLNLKVKNLSLQGKTKKLAKGFYNFYKHQLNKGCYTGISEKPGGFLAEELLNLANLTDHEVVAISIMTSFNMLGALLLAEKAKKKYRLPIVIGGPYVTLFADRFFPKYSFIDYAVAGEGEIPFLWLLRCLQGKERVENVPSLWHRNNSKVAYNRRKFYDIESQTCPDFEGLPLELYQTKADNGRITLTYIASRGCTSKCSFCNFSQIDGPYQRKTIEKVLNDIRLMKEKYNAGNFIFNDSNFNVSYDYVDNLCDAFIAEKLNINWQVVCMRGDNFDERLAAKMKRAGCESIGWGIESGSSKVLKSMNKNISPERLAECLKIAHRAGLKNEGKFILNYPYETIEDLEKTALFIENNAKFLDYMRVNELTVLLKTPLFDNSQKIRIKIKKRKSTFFTYNYDYEEKERNLGEKEKTNIKKIWFVIFAYRQILEYHKNSIFAGRFMLKLVHFLGRKTPDFLVKIARTGIKKFDIKPFGI